MADISVLLIGASGALGKPLLEKLVRQKKQFRRIAILATPDRVYKFKDLDVELIVGSLYDPASYRGQLMMGFHKPCVRTDMLDQVSAMSSLQSGML